MKNVLGAGDSKLEEVDRKVSRNNGRIVQNQRGNQEKEPSFFLMA